MRYEYPLRLCCLRAEAFVFSLCGIFFTRISCRQQTNCTNRLLLMNTEWLESVLLVFAFTCLLCCAVSLVAIFQSRSCHSAVCACVFFPNSRFFPRFSGSTPLLFVQISEHFVFYSRWHWSNLHDFIMLLPISVLFCVFLFYLVVTEKQQRQLYAEYECIAKYDEANNAGLAYNINHI